MKIKIEEIKIKIKLFNNIKHPKAKAHASLTFFDEHKRSMTISGFTVRESKFNENEHYVTPPSRNKFQFFLAENYLWKEIEKEIVKEYHKEEIPIIDK